MKTLATIAALLISASTHAGSVHLAWDAANPEASVAGYKIHVGEASGVYDVVHDVGLAPYTNAPSAYHGFATNLVMGKQYYFAVTAYNANGAESDHSDELVYWMTIVPKFVTGAKLWLIGVNFDE